MDKESKVFVDSTIPPIIDSWDYKELIKHASPGFLLNSPAEEIASVFNVFSETFGPLKSYNGSKGLSNISFTIQDGMMVTAKYIAVATFEKAPATIHMRLIKNKEEWQYKKFHVDSDAFTYDFVPNNLTNI